MIRIDRRTLVLSGAASLGWRPASAQERYPTRPINLIVPNPAGGGYDVVARSVSDQLAKRINGSIVVLNKPGAGSTIGAAYVADAKPDGYTLLFGGAGPLSVAPSLYASVPYDPKRSFSPIVCLGEVPYFLVVTPGLALSVKELLDKARKSPGVLTYGSAGVGTETHLSMELLKMMTGVQITHVPYNGTPPTLIDVIAGRINMTFAPSVVMPYVRSGKMVALAVTSAKRSALLPEVPTLDEAGVTGFSSASYYAILGPAGMPQPIVDTLNAALNQVLQSDQFQDKSKDFGLVTIGGPPSVLSDRIEEDLVKWKKVIDEAGVKAN